jgi:hypothetical protein
VSGGKKMTAVKPNVFTIIQSYGGLKEAYYEVDSVTAADTLDFSETSASGFKDITASTADDGAVIPMVVCETDDTITVGAGPSADLLKGKVLFRDY